MHKDEQSAALVLAVTEDLDFAKLFNEAYREIVSQLRKLMTNISLRCTAASEIKCELPIDDVIFEIERSQKNKMGLGIQATYPIELYITWKGYVLFHKVIVKT